MDFDQFIIYLGSLGRWQIQIFLMVCLVSMGNGIIAMSQLFILYTPEVRCQVPGCDPVDTGQGDIDASHTAFTIPYWDQDDLDVDEAEYQRCARYRRYDESNTDNCSASFFDNNTFYTNYEFCERYHHIYDYDDMKNSYVMEFDLVDCSNLYPDWPFYPTITTVSFLGMAYMIGMLLGTAFCGYFADIFGRIPVMMVSVVTASAFTFIGSFVDNFWAWWSLRLLAGTTSKGLIISAMIISTEIVGTKWRMILGILIQIPYALGEMLVALLAFLIQDWRDLQLTLSLLVLALAGLWFLVPESPRWLLSKGKVAKAEKILRKAAKTNEKHVPEEVWAQLEAPQQGQQLGFKHLFQGWKIARNTIIMYINWTGTTMMFYVLSLNSVNLAGNTYLNFALSAFVEIPSYLFLLLVVDGWGRKPVLVSCQILAGITCIIAGFDIPDWLLTVMTLLGKFCSSAIFAIVYLYTAELYPTMIRSTAVASSSTIAKVGAIIAPIVADLKPQSIAFYIMGATGLVGGALAVLLPETLGERLPETLDDVKMLGRDAKPWYKWMPREELERRRDEHTQKSAMRDFESHDELGAERDTGLTQVAAAGAAVITMDASSDKSDDEGGEETGVVHEEAQREIEPDMSNNADLGDLELQKEAETDVKSVYSEAGSVGKATAVALKALDASYGYDSEALEPDVNSTSLAAESSDEEGKESGEIENELDSQQDSSDTGQSDSLPDQLEEMTSTAQSIHSDEAENIEDIPDPADEIPDRRPSGTFLEATAFALRDLDPSSRRASTNEEPSLQRVSEDEEEDSADKSSSSDHSNILMLEDVVHEESFPLPTPPPTPTTEVADTEESSNSDDEDPEGIRAEEVAVPLSPPPPPPPMPANISELKLPQAQAEPEVPESSLTSKSLLSPANPDSPAANLMNMSSAIAAAAAARNHRPEEEVVSIKSSGSEESDEDFSDSSSEEDYTHGPKLGKVVSTVPSSAETKKLAAGRSAIPEAGVKRAYVDLAAEVAQLARKREPSNLHE